MCTEGCIEYTLKVVLRNVIVSVTGDSIECVTEGCSEA